jgi:hypothetical protein
MPTGFLGALQRTTTNVDALERGAHRAVRIGFASFYVRKDVLYVYLETLDPVRSAAELREAWGEPSFFTKATREAYDEFFRKATAF